MAKLYINVVFAYFMLCLYVYNAENYDFYETTLNHMLCFPVNNLYNRPEHINRQLQLVNANIGMENKIHLVIIRIHLVIIRMLGSQASTKGNAK